MVRQLLPLLALVALTAGEARCQAGASAAGGAEARSSANAVRRAWMSSPTSAPSTRPAEVTAASEELRKLMEELKSIKVSAAQRRPSTQTEPVEANTPAEPRHVEAAPTTQPTQPASQPASRPTLHPAVPVEPLPKELLARLRDLSSGTLAAPASLGDELYAGGHFQAAYVLYEHATKSGDPNARPWALFQMANCVRTSDAAAAEQLYARVSRDHAGTVWAAAADAESKTLAWMKGNPPSAVMKAVDASTAAAAKVSTRPSTRPAPTSAPSKGAAPAGAGHAAKAVAETHPQATEGRTNG